MTVIDLDDAVRERDDTDWLDEAVEFFDDLVDTKRIQKLEDYEVEGSE